MEVDSVPIDLSRARPYQCLGLSYTERPLCSALQFLRFIVFKPAVQADHAALDNWLLIVRNMNAEIAVPKLNEEGGIVRIAEQSDSTVIES